MARLKGNVEEKLVQSDMTPMIDCIFQLLIFFMCSIHFKEVEGKLLSWLPKDKGSQKLKPENLELEEVKVQMDFKDKKVLMYVKNKKVNDMNELMEGVKTLRDLRMSGGDKDPAVVIAPQREVPLQPILDVLSACKAKEYRTEFAILGQTPPQKAPPKKP